MNNQDLSYLIALHHFPKFGSVRLRNLKKHFKTFEQAFRSSPKDLAQAGIESDIAMAFRDWRSKTDINAIFEAMRRENIGAIPQDDPAYPRLLKEIHNPPYVLYYRGRLECAGHFPIAVVGARKYTYYGQQAVEKIVAGLVANKMCVISGLALGIDTLAHSACVKAGGRTIGVLGSGLDSKSLYPAANRGLAEEIIGFGGAVISEFPLRTEPLRYNFPLRNRTISGLSLGTLVVEAGEKSGALITAEYALEQNREVFAVPGNIFSSASIGPNRLLKKGAVPVTEAEDITRQLNLENAGTLIENRKNLPSGNDEQAIINCLGHEAAHINEIIRQSGLKSQSVISSLTLLEMKGLVKNVGNMEFILLP